jgi:hypothetical protein
MIGISLYLIVAGLYSALSDYYPESARPFSLLLATWGVMLGLLLSLVWVRPSSRLLRVVAFVATVPLSLVLLAHLWSGFRFGWEHVTRSIATALVFSVALAFAYFCVAKLIVHPAQANNSRKRLPVNTIRVTTLP